MECRLIVVLIFVLSIKASAGLLDKVSKAASIVDQGLKAVSSKAETSTQKQTVSEQSIEAEQPPAVQQAVKTATPTTSDAESLEVTDSISEGWPLDPAAEQPTIKEGLEASRSGKIAYSGKVKSTKRTELGDPVVIDAELQWGDSADILRKMEVLTKYSEISSGSAVRGLSLSIDPDIGLFKVTITFFKGYGDGVTTDQVKSKYEAKYGQPEELYDESGQIKIGYRWFEEDEIVTLLDQPTYDHNAWLILENSEMNKKLIATTQQREQETETAQKVNATELLDF
jgi:hypothetical protein